MGRWHAQTREKQKEKASQRWQCGNRTWKCCNADRSEKFILPIQHMLAGFRSFDPPTEKKLACHPDLPLFAVTNAYKGRASAVRQATGDLCCIAFYFLLRIGEYT